jgi:hypothetical protein
MWSAVWQVILYIEAVVSTHKFICLRITLKCGSAVREYNINQFLVSQITKTFGLSGSLT